MFFAIREPFRVLTRPRAPSHQAAKTDKESALYLTFCTGINTKIQDFFPPVPDRVHHGASMAVRLKELVAQGKPTRVFGVGQLCYPKVIEMIGLHGGYDAIWLDQEHAGLTIEQIEHAALAARAAGIDTFVRLAA